MALATRSLDCSVCTGASFGSLGHSAGEPGCSAMAALAASITATVGSAAMVLVGYSMSGPCRGFGSHLGSGSCSAGGSPIVDLVVGLGIVGYGTTVLGMSCLGSSVDLRSSGFVVGFL